jgi:hypothetical protein
MRQDAEVDGKISFKGFDLRGLSLKKKNSNNKNNEICETSCSYAILYFSLIAFVLALSVAK